MLLLRHSRRASCSSFKTPGAATNFAGDDALGAMIEAIDGAREFVFFESYIFDDSPAASAVKDALVAAARRGCVVVLVADAVRTASLREPLLQPAAAVLCLGLGECCCSTRFCR